MSTGIAAQDILASGRVKPRNAGEGRSAGHDAMDGGEERLWLWLTIGLYSTYVILS